MPPCSTNLRAERGQARDLHHVLPDVLRQHLREAGEQLLLREALLLEVHAVGIEEDGAAVAELRRELGLEGDLGVLGDRDAELIGHRLQQHAVAGGAASSTAGSCAMSPFFMNRTLMSCPPMSQMTSTSPKKCTALIMCATVSTMFTSADHALFEHVGGVAGRAEAHASRASRPGSSTWPLRLARSSFVSWIGLPFESW